MNKFGKLMERIASDISQQVYVAHQGLVTISIDAKISEATR